jgi:hypothetical protein
MLLSSRAGGTRCALLAGIILAAISPGIALAHWDTMDGPVVLAARSALDNGDVNEVLIWVQPGAAAELQEAFDRTMAVRVENDQVREVADMYFFETAVRLHREGMGESYMGILPAGTPMSQALVAADMSLENGSLTELDGILNNLIASGLHDHFARVMDLRSRLDGTLEAGRAYVDAYIDYVHYAEAVEKAASGAPAD